VVERSSSTYKPLLTEIDAIVNAFVRDLVVLVRRVAKESLRKAVGELTQRVCSRKEAHARFKRGEISYYRLCQIRNVLDGKCANCHSRTPVPNQQRCQVCRDKAVVRDRERTKKKRDSRVAAGTQNPNQGPLSGHRKTCGNCGKKGHFKRYCPND
jgi:uncharacterized membrane protein